MKKFLVAAAVFLLAAASPAFAQARKLSDAACRLDGGAGCGGSGGGSGTVTSVAISGGTTGFSFSGSPITTSGTFTLSGTLAVANGGTNLTTYTLGDILYSSAANTLAKLSGNTTTTKKFLMQVGDGVNSAAPTWTATAADFPTLNQSTTGNAATATALASNPTGCSAGQYANAIAASGNLTCGTVAYSEVSGTPSLGANTSLSNLGAVAINAALATGAGTAAALTATPAAAITTAQAGIAASVTASDAVAGSSVAGAAAGGSVTILAGDAKRLTSGNANGGILKLVSGAGIGTGSTGDAQFFFGGASATTQLRIWGSGSAAGDSGTVFLDGRVGTAPTTHRSTVVGFGAGGALSSGASNTLIGFGAGSSVSTAASCTMVGTYSGVASIEESGGLNPAAVTGTLNSSLGFAAGTTVAGNTNTVALGAYARPTATNTGVVGGIGFLSWQIGSGSSTPLARTLRSPASRAGTDSNVAGSSLNISAGEGTGTAGGGSVRIQTAPAGSTGATANTLSDRRVFAAKQVTLTESTATLVLNVGVASGTVAGGVFSYTIRADDATDFQVIRGDVPWSAVNKGGTITATLGTPVEVTTTSTGTLTNTTTAVVNGNTIDFKLNAVSSLTQTTLHAYVSGTLDGTGVFTTQ